MKGDVQLEREGYDALRRQEEAREAIVTAALEWSRGVGRPDIERTVRELERTVRELMSQCRAYDRATADLQVVRADEAP